MSGPGDEILRSKKRLSEDAQRNIDHASPRLQYRTLDLAAASFKIPFPMAVSREFALDAGMVEPTPEEASERAASIAEFRETCRRAWDGYAETVRTLDNLTDPGVRAVLDLHTPDDSGHAVTCSSCCYDTEMGDMEEWPCETVAAIAGAYDLPLPPMTLYTGSRP